MTPLSRSQAVAAVEQLAALGQRLLELQRVLARQTATSQPTVADQTGERQMIAMHLTAWSTRSTHPSHVEA